MMNPPPIGEESAASTTAEDCTTATPDALQRVHEGVVVGVFLPEEQCVKKKQELLPLAASSSPSSSSSSSVMAGSRALAPLRRILVHINGREGLGFN
jgi:hypothetical protein